MGYINSLRRRTVLLLGLLLTLPLAGCGLVGGLETAVPTAPPAAPIATPQIGVTLVTRAPPTAAVVQVTPSPLPSATPTATATPIIYVIESGDTLLGIAIQRNTSVEAIQTLNPDARANLLQIGQQLILPPPATALFQADRSTPIPIVVAVTAVEQYQTPVGGLWLVGEVANLGDHPVENVRVQLDLFDASGGQLGQLSAWVVPAIIPSGGRAPFGLLLGQPPAGLAYPVTAVVGGATVRELGTRYLDLAVTATDVTIDEGQARVAGVVANEGDCPAVDVVLVATFYDGQGRVTGFQQLAVPGLIAPGETRDFAIVAAPPGGTAVTVHVGFQAMRAVGAP